MQFCELCVLQHQLYIRAFHLISDFPAVSVILHWKYTLHICIAVIAIIDVMIQSIHRVHSRMSTADLMTVEILAI